jgi:hypothetical protein
MPDIDVVPKLSGANAGSYAAGDIVVPRDGDQSPRFRRPRRSTSLETPRLEPLNGWIWKQCTGDGSATSFSFDDSLPANVAIVNTHIYVSGTSGTAATTVALGKSGSTGAYQAASNFSSSMNTAGVKASTTVKAHETSSVTPLVTFSAAWDSGAKLLAGIQYVAAPAIV